MFGSVGIPEILIIVTVILIIFGPKKVPQFMKGLGQGIYQFKNSLTHRGNEEPDEPEKLN